MSKGNVRCPRCGDVHWGNYSGNLCRFCTRIRPNAVYAQRGKVPGVYLIQFLQWYKIGCSADLDMRIRNIEQNLPDDVKLVHVWACKNYRRLELRFHNMYRTKRVKGEWFVLTDEDVQFMQSISAKGYGEL